MTEYLRLLDHVLTKGITKRNRTGVDTISVFGCFYKVALADGYPLLTSKKVNFKAMLHELFWYISGAAHINNLRQKTKIWNAWATEQGLLETAYGRFWRRYPLPDGHGCGGEAWAAKEPWVKKDSESGGLVFDQLAYLVDSIKEVVRDPAHPSARRLLVTAWHPANAAVSKLPPCHYTFCFYVDKERLSVHLTQRSADIAIGVPFNLACYSLLTMMLAQECGLLPGEFAHSIVDAHIYRNQIDGVKQQLTREPLPLPRINIADKPFFALTADDIELVNYRCHPPINFAVAV